ncbi:MULTISPECIES: hypothetical protein [Brachybacterium]|uniref:hypothetical protein n=1 Tax=Brachybacterium TaxID=43668 RepID=UPI0012E83CF9|nr:MULTISPECIES: hypothetical protein [Brachybacterium]
MLGHPLPPRAAPRLLAAGGVLVLAVPVLPALAGPVPAGPVLAEGEPPAIAYAAEGPEVSGGASLAEAPSLDPGLHRDVLERGGAESGEDGTVKYYRIAVEDGQRVHAAATIAAPPVAGGLPEESTPLTLDVSFLTAGGEACDDSGRTDVGESQEGDGPITTTAVSGAMGPDGCAGEELFVKVAREGPKDREDPLPVELQLAVQPAGLGGGAPALEEPLEDDGARPVAPEDPEPLEPGRSIAEAREVDPGSYVLELVPGETALLRLEVQEGQRLRWRTEIVSAPEDEPGQLSLRVVDAVRAPVAVNGGRSAIGSSGTVRGGGMAAPVDLGNRASDQDSIRSAWLPGTYTIQMHRMQRTAGADPAGDERVRLILTLEVEGDPAEDAAEGPVLELGDIRTGPGTAVVLRLAGAGALGLVGLALAAAGAFVLRPRRT